MLKAALIGCVSVIGMAMAPSAAQGAIYQQDFESHTSGLGIGSINNPGGTGSTEQVTGTAAHSGLLGWQFFAQNNDPGARFRAYDELGVVLTQDDSFELSFWINNYAKASSSENVGFVGLFDSTSMANSTNAQASMKHFIGINLGGRGADFINPAYNFVVDANGALFKEHVDTAVITGGMNQWFQVELSYDATTRGFTYRVSDSADVTQFTKSYTLPGGATFQVDSFGGSNGNATDGRSMGVYVDDISLVPEPSALGLMACAGLVALWRRRD